MLAVIAAMQKEADVLLSLSRTDRHAKCFGKEVYECNYNGHDFRLILSGVGKTNAAAAAMLAIASGADKVLNFGVAGGLTPQTKIGTFWQICRAVQYDFDLSKINGTQIGTLDEYQTPYFPLQTGGRFPTATLATADSFANGDDDADILRALRADICDMEGAAVAHIAFAAGVPCYMFKSISDNAGEESEREYRENMQIALSALQKKMPAIFDEVCNG